MGFGTSTSQENDKTWPKKLPNWYSISSGTLCPYFFLTTSNDNFAQLVSVFAESDF